MCQGVWGVALYFGQTVFRIYIFIVCLSKTGYSSLCQRLSLEKLATGDVIQLDNLQASSLACGFENEIKIINDA